MSEIIAHVFVISLISTSVSIFYVHYISFSADLGWSIHTFNKRKTFCGTLYYLAPEVDICIIST